MNFLDKIFPFGKKERLDFKEETKRSIHRLIVESPELWEAVKDVAYTMMNQKARLMVLADKEKRDDYANAVLTIEDFVKTCLNINSERKDEVVDTSGHLPVMEQKKELEKDLKKKGAKNIMFYLASKDLIGKDGKKRLTVDRPLKKR